MRGAAYEISGLAVMADAGSSTLTPRRAASPLLSLA